MRHRAAIALTVLTLLAAACSQNDSTEGDAGQKPSAEVGGAKASTDGDDKADGDDKTAAADASASETTPPGTLASETVASEATAADDASPPAESQDGLFSEDFSGADAMSRFEIGLFHRDDSLTLQLDWPGDHQSTGPDDLCGPPTEKRPVTRGERTTDFNNDWVYRCVPGGDLGKAHVMTTIGDTSGYSIGAFTPIQTFSGVREVRWDVNQTDLGDRQWTEMVIIPVENFDFQLLPCTPDVPCATVHHPDIGSVGTQWGALRTRHINTIDQPAGYDEAGTDSGYRCNDCPYGPSSRYGEAYGAGDPALTSIAIRRKNYFRDNGDGTLTWGFELEDGSFRDFSVPGSFPEGEVKVVFKDHNYTPLKSPAELLPETTFTWHWDNIQIDYGEAAR